MSLDPQRVIALRVRIARDVAIACVRAATLAESDPDAEAVILKSGIASVAGLLLASYAAQGMSIEDASERMVDDFRALLDNAKGAAIPMLTPARH